MQKFLIRPSSPSSAAKDEQRLAEVDRKLIPVEEFLKQLKKKKKRSTIQAEFKVSPTVHFLFCVSSLFFFICSLFSKILEAKMQMMVEYLYVVTSSL